MPILLLGELQGAPSLETLCKAIKRSHINATSCSHYTKPWHRAPAYEWMEEQLTVWL